MNLLLLIFFIKNDNADDDVKDDNDGDNGSFYFNWMLFGFYQKINEACLP